VTGFQCQSANRGLAAAWRAGDLVQETLLRVARRWGKVRTMAYPGAYARRVLVNLALVGAKRRSRERDELITDDGLGHPPDEAPSTVPQRCAVRANAPSLASGVRCGGRGPVRGPSHRCKQCNQGHRRHGSVVSVQVERPER